MIDIKLLRDQPDVVRASQRARGEDESLVDAALAADERRRSAIADFESVRAEQKASGKDLGPLMGRIKAGEKAGEDVSGLRAQAEELKAKGGQLASRVKELDAVQSAAQGDLDALLRQIGNVIEPGVPTGGEDDFALLETVGAPRDFAAEGFEPKDHLELGESLRAIDMERGTKVAGSRFYFLTGVGAQLELALLTMAAAQATQAGFTLMIPPTLASRETMAGAGFIDAHEEEVYRLEADDLFLTGTSEVALAGYHSGEVIDLSGGPLRYAGWSTCYRREAGSYGKDTRGIIRVHQFNKLEMFVYCDPADAAAEHQRLLAWEREMLAKVELPYRIIDTAAGDLGGPAARKYDCEAWVPTQGRYRELTSTSNCTTYQARRLGTRFKDADGKTQVAATLNGTLATTRWLVAILENHQQADGSVRVPEALQPYLGLEVLTPQA
ncbi:serine--tRNA ligase [Marihabitans asiaticum]|uniref:Serine--tRNA ligase n=1 Tax=Marihabitans asiaticum TaxID=415218 RepID=A0A560WGV3_9MICO|nr:serine--tRNA ligase [Marihabitans asiaticum]TWD16913.1 seryl-tRNA synthetase [Marihabitans asiaticum]